MRKTRSYASLGDRRLRASCTSGLSSGIKSSALQQPLGQRSLLIPSKSPDAVRYTPAFSNICRIPQTQLPVARVVKVPFGERLHPALQPRALHDLRCEGRDRHDGRRGSRSVGDEVGGERRFNAAAAMKLLLDAGLRFCLLRLYPL